MSSDEINSLRGEVSEIKELVKSTNHNVVRLLSTIGKQPIANEGGSSSSGGTATVDLGPIEERLDELQTNLLSKTDFDKLVLRVEELNSEKMREAQTTIDRVTSLLEQGLELVRLENTLNDLKTLLEETVLGSPPSD
ncbi:MAG: hypothetical protein KAR35_00095 [Candidatus Heimdallarchaeota archaeon]|nr:hypothetical protein [Candidatus Heimdallarchaeota archaeon]MCK5047750.1 hypothetical protein [Candidatus Heimdallarchaeota archaeon]